MLVKVAIKNFRNFEEWFEFDLQTSKNYEFNAFAVNKNIVKHAMIYGQNGGGKSNLGLAILDITCHLNDMVNASTFSGLNGNYLNANSGSDLAEFKYTFDFNGTEVVYLYGKHNVSHPIYEQLDIDGKCYINIDRRKSGLADIQFKGTESLKKDLTNNSNISVLKYLNSNALLDPTPEAKAFDELMQFVKGMVFFRTLNKRSEHHGVIVEATRISKEIIDAGKLKDFDTFLNESGVECELTQAGAKGDERIEFVFKGNNVEFSLAASSGTQSLGVFYYWWLKLQSNELTFAYIDEFDAFYHHALAKQIVKKLSELNCQTILTTHNTGIMSNDLLRPDCYFEVRGHVKFKDLGLPASKQKEKPGMYPFFSLVDKELRKAHNLEKIYKGLGAAQSNG